MNIRKEFHRKPDYKSIDVASINTFTAHTRWGAYDSLSAAIACQPYSSPYILSLNGDYKFKLFASPEAVDDFFKPGYDTNGFTDLKIPCNWELSGHSYPIYTNQEYPWNYQTAEDYMIQPGASINELPNPPHIPQDNPTGCFLRIFTVPENFNGRNTYIRFEGVEGAFYLWVNGIAVGYNEDSKLPVEFDISEYLKPGANTIALQVMRWSKSTYLEDQDYWHLSGIYRNVWLISKPAMCIIDYKVDAIPDIHRGTGSVNADITISRKPGYADFIVRTAIYDNSGQLVAESKGKVSARSGFSIKNAPASNSARIALNVEKMDLWTPETPVLYTFVATLVSPDGVEVDYEACRIGFKLVQIINGVVHLNGKRLVIYGVNRHDHCSATGRAVPKEHMIKEIIEMKRMNINSVRTCHYPDSPEWYDLCDEYGLLLISECNLETHGVLADLSLNAEWAKLYLDRAIRMVLNYKNNACVYSWSLGNESGTGPNHAAMAGFIRNYDPTRLCQYESGAPGADVSDVRCAMYSTVDEIMAMLCDTRDIRPIILVEYLYQIHNSGGGMDRFIELTEKYERFQGAYVWDWQDKCLTAKTDAGEEFFAYGGDFGEPVTESTFQLYMTCNGIVLPDLTWKPVAYEVKQAYAPIRITPTPNITMWIINRASNTYIIKNKSHTRSLKEYRITANLRENGIIVKSLLLNTEDAAPLNQCTMTIDIPYDKKPECDYAIDFSIKQKFDVFYADAGYEVGFSQNIISSSVRNCALVRESILPISLMETEDFYEIKSSEMNLVFSRKQGVIASLSRYGAEYLKDSARICLDMPFTGLDTKTGWGWYDMFKPFRFGNLLISNVETTAVLVNSSTVNIRVITTYETKIDNFGAATITTYEIHSDGIIDVNCDFDINQNYAYLPRVGLELVIPQDYEKLTYYGYGDNENYSDRLLSAKLGVHESAVENEHFAFIPPSENGGHEGTRWLTLTDDNGRGIKISSANPFHFDVHHNTVVDYQQASHEHLLFRRNESYLHIDAAHFGIGSNMAWSSAVDEKYCVKAGCYNLKFRLTLV